jgi:hypothetical protein
MTQYLVFLGAAISFAGGTFYIKETLIGKTKPNRVTWLMWAIAPLIATSAALADGVRLAALPVFMSGFMPLLVFLASFANSKAYWKLEKFDYFCGASSVLALALWIITKEPTIAIIFAIISDGFAALPTIIKSWKHPDTESTEIFVCGLFSAFTAFFALKTFGFSELAFPIYLISVNTLLVIAGYRGRWIKRNLP